MDDKGNNMSWLACFEVVSQTNNRVDKEKKLFFQKQVEEEDGNVVDAETGIVPKLN